MADIPSLISVHQAANVKVCLLRAIDIPNTISRLEQVAAAGALLASEGPNEPNNFPVTYNGQTSGFKTTFIPVAQFQRDMYAAVKADPKLNGIPVFHSSEAGGAEPDNVGLQFLTIPNGASTTMPDGTQYADYANVHNYVAGNGITAPINNDAWDAASPDRVRHFDGIYPEYEVTWHKRFPGYTNAQAQTVPRVTTETGWPTMGTNAITEDKQGKLFMSLYLAQFKRGFKYTFIYELHDNRGSWWGIFHNDYTPKLSATYLHNMTTILADNNTGSLGTLGYSIPSEPVTVHDLLLQKSNGKFELIVWDENVSSSDSVTLNLGASFSSVSLYDPTLGTSPTKTLSNVSSVPLTLSDHLIIIEIGP